MKAIKQFLKEYKETIYEEAFRIWDEPMPKLTKDLFDIYEQTGNRLIYENAYFLRRKYVMIFGLLAWLEKNNPTTKVKYKLVIEKLECILIDICEEICWALPAHVDCKKENWEITIELFASETAQTLSEILFMVGDDINSNVKNKVTSEVFRRVLNPFFSSQVPYDWWEQCDLNWCAVCNGAIGSAAMYLMKDEPEKLKKCLNRVTNSMKYYLDGFCEDGTCMEGLYYFTYGFTYFTGFAYQLRQYTKGVVNLFHNPKVEKIASFQQKCYFKSGKTVSFSDGSEEDHYHIGLTCRLAMEYETVYVPNIRFASKLLDDHYCRFMGAFRNIIWAEEYIKSAQRKNDNINDNKKVILENAQWAIYENKSGIGMAVKGGHNDEPHNHNDIGSFMYIKEDEIFLPDLGAGEYTKEYFHEGRYHIFCNNSFSHNVPVINGIGQQEGSEYCCSQFQVNESGAICLEISNAYKKDIIEKLYRRMDFSFLEGTLTIIDEFYGKENLCITENLISYIKPIIDGQDFILNGKKNNCRIKTNGYNLSVIPVDHALHNGKHITVYRMCWNIKIINERGKATIFIQ